MYVQKIEKAHFLKINIAIVTFTTPTFNAKNLY